MLNPASPLARLLAAPMRPGVVRWIGIRPERRAAMVAVAEARLDPASGMAGDHYRGTATRSRQVTVISDLALEAIGACLGGVVPAEQLRRNVVVAGINLHALRGHRFRLGGALLEVTGECHPCSRMEAVLGPGGYNAVRGHGGITARVLLGGVVRVGDVVAREALEGG